MSSFKIYYYLYNYLFVLLFQLDAHKRTSFSESIHLSIIIIIINEENVSYRCTNYTI